MDIVVKASNLSKTYSIFPTPKDRLFAALGLHTNCAKVSALEDFSISLNKGDVLGILGRNGAGKSTLLKILTRVMEPSSGEVITRGKISSILELGVGINPEYSGLENARLSSIARGVSIDNIEATLSEIISFSELGEAIDRPLKTYSSGMISRLLFSAAIFSTSDIIIIDEALAAGDTLFQAKCLDHIKKIASCGATILFVSHSIDLVQQLCNRAIVMHEGRKICDSDIHTASNAYHHLLAETRQVSSQVITAPPVKTAFTDSKILQALIYNSNGDLVSNLVSGESHTVLIQAYSSVEILNAYVGFRISLPSGLILFATSNLMLNTRVSFKPNETKTIRFMFIPRLQAGSYILGCGLAISHEIDPVHSPNITTLDIQNSLLSFTVSSTRVHGGYADLDVDVPSIES